MSINNIHINSSLRIDTKPLSQKWSFLNAVSRLPSFLYIITVCTVMAYYGGNLFGYKITGIAWVVPLSLALIIIARRVGKITFPVLIWLPWVLFLFAQLLLVDFSLIDERVSPVQRTIQLLSPLIIGMAVSTYRPTENVLQGFISLCRLLAIVLLVIVAIITGILLTGSLPGTTGLAPQVMTVIVLGSFFINRYIVVNNKKDIYWWSVLAIVPFIAVTRTAIAVMLLTFPLALGPMRWSRRIVAVILIVLIAIAAFYSPRIQKKMFHSGQGEMSDVMSKDFATSGRSGMWTEMYSHLDDNMINGYGTGFGETFTYRYTGHLAYPHNDWLLTLYDYGIVGVSLYLSTLVLALLHARRQAEYVSNPEIKTLYLAGASAFIPFGLMMFTDNIMVYASFFGNLHFTILGLAYGASQQELEMHGLSDKRPL